MQSGLKSLYKGLSKNGAYPVQPLSERFETTFTHSITGLPFHLLPSCREKEHTWPSDDMHISAVRTVGPLRLSRSTESERFFFSQEIGSCFSNSETEVDNDLWWQIADLPELGPNGEMVRSDFSLCFSDDLAC